MTKVNIMINAWEIAKNAAKKFGGKAIEYISGALKMAWKMAKGLSEKQIKALENKGFNRWTKYGKDRLYFDMVKAGFMEVSYYKSGFISYSKLQGEEISHSFAGELLGVKVWIDVQTGEMHSKAYDDYCEKIVVDLAQKALQSI